MPFEDVAVPGQGPSSAFTRTYQCLYKTFAVPLQGLSSAFQGLSNSFTRTSQSFCIRGRPPPFLEAVPSLFRVGIYAFQAGPSLS